MKTIRCAIYTRKSSEEGLEQDFNSLDAQYAACSAYIASQTSEGWTLVDQRYDDGGISGGTLERPALQRLLQDLITHRIDIVVVYKLDRLTRSLLDFAKLVEVLEKANTSFVSVTQSFNTTTSMGRLTLNMLLSFAQFEREVTAERIRDKLAASRARGMWMGGTPPLGYRPDGRSLSIVEDHADLVRKIFERYLALGNVRRLQEELQSTGITKPRRLSKAGRSFGGTPFVRGELYAILSNPIYIGRIRGKNTLHEGLHPAIIDQDLWEQVQAKLTDNRQGDRYIRTEVQPSTLIGKLFDDGGEPMVVSHANKNGRRYRYYVSRSLQHKGNAEQNAGMRLPAREIEGLVTSKLAELFDDPIALIDSPALAGAPSPDITQTIAAAQKAAETLRGSDAATIASATSKLVTRVDIAADTITITLDPQQWANQLNIGELPAIPAASPWQVTVPASLKRSGLAMRLILPDGGRVQPQMDEKLIKTIATARQWWDELVAEPQLRIADLAGKYSVTESWFTRVLRLAFLDPAIVDQALKGTAPASLSSDTLRATDAVPVLWSEQRKRHRITTAQ